MWIKNKEIVQERELANTICSLNKEIITFNIQLINDEKRDSNTRCNYRFVCKCEMKRERKVLREFSHKARQIIASPRAPFSLVSLIYCVSLRKVCSWKKILKDELLSPVKKKKTK